MESNLAVADSSYGWTNGCSTCRWSEITHQGLYCRFWRAYAYRQCKEWEREPGADEREEVQDQGFE